MSESVRSDIGPVGIDRDDEIAGVCLERDRLSASIATLTAEWDALTQRVADLQDVIGQERDSSIRIASKLADERDAAMAEAGRLREALKHYGGVHLEDHGVCVACSLDERLNDEAADWPCWYTLLMDSATTPPAASAEGARDE